MVAEVVALAFLVPASLFAAYYFAFTLIGMMKAGGLRLPANAEQGDAVPPLIRHSFAVLIPAHNEEAQLPHCLRSIPASPLVSISVVADNCTDTTAQVATALGAACIERTDTERIGKGYALAHGLSAALAGKPDAVLMLDADCELAPGTLAAFDAALSCGEQVVQTPIIMRPRTDGDAEYIAAVGAEIDNAVLRGTHRLGGSIPLRGMGMLFRREVLESHPWTMHGLAEDAEFTAVLRRAGIRVKLLQGGAVYTSAPTHSVDLLQQRRRWCAALRVPGLGLVNKLITSKPLILTHLAFTASVVAMVQPPVWMIAWLLSILVGTAFVYLRAMAKVGIRWPRYSSAALVAKLAGVAIAGFWNRDAAWHRTARG